LCDKHWDFSQQLETALGEDPAFAKKFAEAIEEQEQKIN
jgi:hypothetical protein